MQTTNTFQCRHCHREIIFDGLWIDNNAIGDDQVWSETCDSNDSFIANHEPMDTCEYCDATDSYNFGQCISCGETK